MCPFHGIQFQGYVISTSPHLVKPRDFNRPDKRVHYRTLFQLIVALKGVRIPIDPLHLGSRDQIFPLKNPNYGL